MAKGKNLTTGGVVKMVLTQASICEADKMIFHRTLKVHLHLSGYGVGEVESFLSVFA